MADPTVSITAPPEFLQSYYAALAQKGATLGTQDYTAYTADKVAPWTDQQNAAAQMIQQRALTGSGAMNQAGQWFGNALQGQYNVGPVASGGQASVGNNPYAGMDNPYLNTAINRAQDDVQTRINSQFGNGNAFGNTAHQETMARELGNVSNQMRMQDYSQQQGLAENAVNRNWQNQQFNIGNQNQLNQFNAGLQNQNYSRQQNALNFAPQLAQNDYMDAQALFGVGGAMQQTNQSIADANYQEFLRQQGWGGEQMNYMAAGLNPSGSTFSNTTATQPQQQSNTLANLAGAGATLWGGYNLFK